MGAFEYSAIDSRGREKRGVLEGDTPRQVRQQLRELGLTPLELREAAQQHHQGGKQGLGERLTLRRGMSPGDLAVITRQLATLVRAGLPLEEAIQTTAQQSEKPRHTSLLLAVRAKVMEGRSFATGLAEYPEIFPEIYRTTVAAGEQSGHLDLVLERLADYTEKRQIMRQKLQMALFYPIILTIMALAVTTALLVYVVPEVVQVFDSIGQEMPPLTLGLIALSSFLQHYGIYLLLLLLASSWGARLLLRREPLRFRWHQLLHRLPLLARLLRGVNTARFARTFSIMVASSVPALESMRIAAEVITSLPMRHGVHTAADRVREGAHIAPSLAQCGYFPPIVVHLIASGEASGELEQMLERAADNQERELETLVGMLMGLFEPLLLVVMGSVVMLIVLAILLPIFEINQLVK
ncbi:MAG: type II secretion system inner membrane protein GspF [Gammaproteobacteria bacterium]|nr:type II secretion system inner membrane protein GspF [Gammaproteobacteria bacterium]